jgi:threonine/homoserine/homoserine lactone efflux protein
MLESLWMGCAAGFLAGFPIGPMGAVALENVTRRKIAAALCVGGGAALGMLLWSLVAATLLEPTQKIVGRHEHWFQLAVAGLFAFVSFSGWRRLQQDVLTSHTTNTTIPKNTNKTDTVEERDALAWFAKASAIGAFRPTTAVIVSAVVTALFPGRLISNVVPFALAACAANFLGFATLIFSAQRILKKSSEKMLFRIRVFLVIFMAGFAAVLVAKATLRLFSVEP